jgi:hypothetical protein
MPVGHPVVLATFIHLLFHSLEMYSDHLPLFKIAIFALLHIVLVATPFGV